MQKLVQSGKNFFRSFKCVITPALPTFYPFAPLFELIIAYVTGTLCLLQYIFKIQMMAGKAQNVGESPSYHF